MLERLVTLGPLAAALVVAAIFLTAAVIVGGLILAYNARKRTGRAGELVPSDALAAPARQPREPEGQGSPSEAPPRAEAPIRAPKAPDPYPGRPARTYARLGALAWGLAFVVPALIACVLVAWPALDGEDMQTVATPDGETLLVGWRSAAPAWAVTGYTITRGDDVVRDHTAGRALNAAGTLLGENVPQTDPTGYAARANGRAEFLPLRDALPLYGAPFAVIGCFFVSASFRARTTPTRHELDAYRGDRAALGLFLGLGTLAAVLVFTWWFLPGNTLLEETLRELRAFTFAWKAGAVNRGAWLMEKAALFLVLGLLAALAWFFPYRMRYPDLLRVAPKAHAGEPATLGRLFHVQPFTESVVVSTTTSDEGLVVPTLANVTRYRFMYKHAFRLFPPLFLHTVDLPDREEPWGLGQVVVKSDRLARDYARRGRRKPKADPYAAHALGTTYREAILAEDRERGQARAMAGALMNVDTARAKVRAEPTIMPQARALLREETLKLQLARAKEMRRAAGLPVNDNGDAATTGGGSG